jgi:hypothetical protein
MSDVNYKQLCVDMLEAWEIACCPVMPSDPDVVFNRARLALAETEAIAALDDLYANNDEGMKRLADS